jgi:uncharacterized membrane protein (UPF0127 family)
MTMRWRRATTFATRLVGLLGQPPLQQDEALLIAPCRAVHTFGMRYCIDVVFLDERNRVIKIVAAMPPRRIAWCWRARMVVELAAGETGHAGLQPGQRMGENCSCAGEGQP